MKRLLLATALFLSASTSWAGQADVMGVRMWPAPDNTRLVFDLSGPTEHTLFTLKNPDRIVVDLQNARLRGDLPAVEGDDNPIKSLRSATRNQTDLRIVLDANQALRPKSFALKPYGEHGHRLVLDLQHIEQKRVVAKSSREPARDKKETLRDVIIAIDAGHGGEDPGARGHRGTQEKQVVLAVARKLEALVKEEPGMRPVMIRNGDYFIRLRDRINKARTARADIFISIHADAFHNPKAKGSSVYTLSRRGASSEAARFLAASENNADLIGGVSLDDKDDLLASVLLDLSQTASLEASLDVAGNILGGLKQLGKTHKRRVQSANFLVLKSPDIPSVLVETAFISNPEEERKLRTAAYQQRLATAMMNGIRNYFERFPPPGTRLARRHTIQNGETLSGIAEHYRVSMQYLRVANNLESDNLRVGQTLRIPSQNSDS
ncbi:N-acetylmuramoyl-L-alanine amidase [Sulfuriflexus mobilis]|uniref:N-acetylmuramoyl-L-alanine amidase n=1 Tax=Sulfuriflexus mobilis TaxID=1811807 RepID=UPI000F8393AA|nr:N-acetylmuramoyl-L-alanine amidase [Sulfuriflexus mobilis]